MFFHFSILLGSALVHGVSCVPLSVEGNLPSLVTAVFQPQATGSLLNLPVDIQDLVTSFKAGTVAAEAFEEAFVSKLGQLTPTSIPTSIPDAISRLEKILAPKPTNLLVPAAQFVLNGLSPGNIKSAVSAFGGINSPVNVNKRQPSKPVFPKKNSADAPYYQTEQQMRQQIYFPAGFTYGAKPPVLLVPGTGARGGVNFEGNMIKALKDESYADLVWINPGDFQLADAQQNAETVAYAINYISSISKNKPVSVITWSQGSLSMQWALKYWPSIRPLVPDFIAISPDYDATVLADTFCLSGVPCAPSVFQQNANSAFVQALHKNGGDQAYVPTTNVYSGLYDEIVEPQQGTGASGYISDVRRRTGVTNNELQATCGAKGVGGQFADHESILFNGLAIALAKDALTHAGPGKISRLDLNTICQQIAAPGLTLDDVLATESVIPLALYLILTYPNKRTGEPAVRPFAQKY